ncbi:nuclear transport factor 2 family protein [Shewanella eurypsychrophilus]|uniref:Nuclear transport factor 2 family protein n=1 Tax=Shewanella eurypsychrophilus TaxID=2593656 RepID=A0ABX6V537_9GAMM|nr:MULTISPECIES: nuclear transport factor 2 family protein [Shewanella]QPG57660.2 nuclear transport factor 2 family protein [Shewanella eurypsychrophilus]
MTLTKITYASGVIVLALLYQICGMAYATEWVKKHYDPFMGLETESAKVVTQFHQALKRGDEERVNNLLAEDVVIVENGKINRSRYEYINQHMKEDMLALNASKTVFHELSIKVNGSTAIATARKKIIEVERGEELDMHNIETMVLNKQSNGRWKISYIHWSS